MATGPHEWTDDLGVAPSSGATPADLVEFILQAVVRDTNDEEIDRTLALEFGLSEEDAMLVRDRTFAGAVRAGTKNPKNAPDAARDPIAWASYERCVREPNVLSQFRAWEAKRGVGVPVAASSKPPASSERLSVLSRLWQWFRQ